MQYMISFQNWVLFSENGKLFTIFLQQRQYSDSRIFNMCIVVQSLPAIQVHGQRNGLLYLPDNFRFCGTSIYDIEGTRCR